MKATLYSSNQLLDHRFWYEKRKDRESKNDTVITVIIGLVIIAYMSILCASILFN